MMRIAPRSLAGQLALLVAAALFVAQAINFALLFSERRDRRINQVVVPAIVRLVDAVDRFQRNPARIRQRPRRALLRRIEIAPSSGVTAAMAWQPAVERRLSAALAEAGVQVLDVKAAEASRHQSGLPRRRQGAGRRAPGRVLVLSVKLAPSSWLTIRSPIAGGESALVWRLLVQTTILYIVLLAAVLWIGRRAAKPLQELAAAAGAFGNSAKHEPVVEQGPADIRQLTAAFNAMHDRLAALLEEKDRMLGAIGHDLRTPLASLRLRAEGVEDAPDRERMVATIEEMSRMLDDILSLAQAGRSSEPIVRIDLPALVDAVIQDLRDLGGNASFEPSPRLVLPLRPLLTRRAVRNLVENAIKYGDSAVVRVRSDGANAVIEIDDGGPGLADEALDRMFESFTRLETSRNRETGGAGLGLALARAIVRDQGGDIRLENRSPRGLRASILLPLPEGFAGAG